METDALLFMLAAWGFSIGLIVFCIVKHYKNSD